MIILDLFLTFLKIGAFTFGGGYAMLPLIQEEVARHGWLTQAQLVDFVAVSESTPGPFAINIATFVGVRTGGLFGAFCSTFGVVLPSFVIILIVAKFYEKFSNSRVVKGIMSGLKPAVVGLITAAFLSILKTVFCIENASGVSLHDISDGEIWLLLAIFIASAVFAFKKVHPIILILASAAIGIAAGYLLNMFGIYSGFDQLLS
ncbi:MAG: chromate transporter [Clostridia bacterium]|nr:chromate transporter [Clostridia bacterium]